MEVIPVLLGLMLLAFVFMVAADILYTVAAAVLPLAALLLVLAAVCFGCGVAVRNTVLVYRKVFRKKVP